MALPSMVIQKSRTTVNSSIVNNILYTIWYDMLNIANNSAAEYGNIQKSRTTVNSSIVNNILYAIWYDMLNIVNIMYCTLPHCVLYHIMVRYNTTVSKLISIDCNMYGNNTVGL
jgi:hypothetical protein